MWANNKGFTLLEILVALFIFTIVAMMTVGALHTVFNTQSATEKKSENIAELQIAMTLLSRDFEQIVDRPITNASGQVEASFIGEKNTATFTHAGLANPTGTLQRSTLQRTQYRLENGNLIRESWPELDQVPQSQPSQRILLNNVTSLQFRYLDKDGHFQPAWPSPDQPNNNGELPRAVRVIITLKNLGKMSQLYIIPGQKIEKTS